ncbi:MAG: hypothetical protein ACFUZC_17995 [Chthoniobacteraceae bacterium]
MRPRNLRVRAWWALLLGVGLTACGPEGAKPVQSLPPAPEALHFETQYVRREVDRYKDAPSPTARKKMDQAFAALDAKVSEMESRAATLTGDAQADLQRQIANLKLRRDLHWTRAQAAVVQLEPVEKAQPVVGERTARAVKARPDPTAQAAAARARARRVYRQTPMVPQENFIQRLGRFFQR